jgi:hypothetical protein
MFAEGYRAARDKLVYLRLAHIPFELPSNPDSDSDSRMHLKRLRIEEIFEVGNVTPAFGSTRLIHHMYPQELVESHKSLKFVYVHHDGTVEKSLHELFGLVVEDADHHD